MAHKKGVGSSKNGRDSNAKRLGAKIVASVDDDNIPKKNWEFL